jgi:glycosyltransferase involved in cell wall biosynthesis
MTEVKKLPLVSVVIPVYNSEAYISKALESVLHQTYKNLEVIVIDDGSKDRSWETIQHYIKTDNRIIALNNGSNIGIAKTRNKALRIFHGIYLAPLDSDDVWESLKIQKQVDFLNKNRDVGIVGTNVDIINEKSKKLFTRVYPRNFSKITKDISVKNPFCQSSVMIRRSIIKKVGFYDESLETSEDYDYWFRIIRVCNGENIQEPLTYYRARSGQLKQEKLKSLVLNTLKIKRRYIFDRRYFSINSLTRYLFEYLLLFLPSPFILSLFWFSEKRHSEKK